MRYRIDQLPERYRAQAQAQLKDRVAVCAPVQECDGKKALDSKKEVPRLDAPVHIRITVYKIGDGWDTDNREIKGLLDSLTAAGILEDDCIRIVPEITKRGVRVKTKAEEKTIITIEER